MNHSAYKAVIADIDGTLVQYRPDLSGLHEADAFIPQSAIAAVKKLHAEGVKVAAVTGRTYEQSKVLLVTLGITGPCVFAGGATIRIIPSGDILYEASMSEDALGKVVGALFSLLGDDYPLELAAAVKNIGMTNSVWAVIDKETVGEIIDKLSQINDIYYVINEGAGLTTQSGLLILRDRADKGSGTRQLLGLLDVESADTACIGDGANDVLMFQECGLNIAMGNGEDILKQSADHVVSDIDKDGFAEAVKLILLNHRRFHGNEQ